MAPSSLSSLRALCCELEEGEWGGQGPLSTICCCEVNRLGHSVVTVIVVDTVVRLGWWWWWWGGNTMLLSLLSLSLLFQWYRQCYHAVLVVIDVGVWWWWWHGGIVVVSGHEWCHRAVVIISVAQVGPSYRRRR